MKGRGQISVFVILGILILVGTAIYFIAQNFDEDQIKDEARATEKIPVERAPIQNYIESCIRQVAPPLIKEIGLRGGTLGQTKELLFEGKTYRFLCVQSGNHGCVNQLASPEKVEAELSYSINKKTATCIDFTNFEEQGFIVGEGTKNVIVDIAPNTVEITLAYPLTFQREGFDLHFEEFHASIPLPLGRTLLLANEILNEEIKNNHFDASYWMYEHGDESRITKKKPYPHITYQVETFAPGVNEIYNFLFAIEGKDTVQFIGTPTQLEENYGWCKEDTHCFANTPSSVCTGESSANKPSDCKTTSDDIQPLCEGSSCSDCGNRKHGESWCEFDAPSGKGRDYVGNRHYVKSCTNGIVTIEPCRDYREELCASSSVGSLPHAECKPNRWETCSMQTSQSACEDTQVRDCIWDGSLSSGPGKKGNTRNCHPNVPPGFKFWQGIGEEVCRMGNQMRDCDGESCPQVWTDNAARSCYALGDCGNYRNIGDVLSTNGFRATDSQNGGESHSVYPPAGFAGMNNGYVITTSTNRGSLPLTGDEFHYPKGEHGYMMSQMQEYAEWVQDLDEEELMWQYIEEGEIEFHTRHANVCSLYQPGQSDCSICGSAPGHSCTEYACRSLGNCIFSVTSTGFGICSSPGDEDKDPLVITFQPDMLMIEDDEKAKAITSVPSLFQNYAGYQIAPPLEPYQKFAWGFTTNKPAQCKIFPIPGLEYSDIPLLENASYQRTHHKHTMVLPQNALRESLEQIENIVFLAQLGSIEHINSVIDSVESDANTAAQEFEVDISGLERELTRIREAVNGPIREVSEEITTVFGNLFDRLLFELDNDNAYLFVSCIDQMGEVASNAWYVKYTIGKDTSAPRIIEIEPQQNEQVSGLTPVTIQLSEPAICSYDQNDKGFDQMEHEMICTPPGITLPGFSPKFFCEATVDTSVSKTWYMRCMDNPITFEKFKLTLKKGSKLSVAEEHSNVIRFPQGNEINIGRAFILRKSPTITAPGDATYLLTIKTPEEYTCKISTQTDKFEFMEDDIICTAKECKADLAFTTASERQDIFITCISKIPVVQHTNDKSFAVNWN